MRTMGSWSIFWKAGAVRVTIRSASARMSRLRSLGIVCICRHLVEMEGKKRRKGERLWRAARVQRAYTSAWKDHEMALAFGGLRYCHAMSKALPLAALVIAVVTMNDCAGNCRPASIVHTPPVDMTPLATSN